MRGYISGRCGFDGVQQAGIGGNGREMAASSSTVGSRPSGLGRGLFARPPNPMQTVPASNGRLTLSSLPSAGRLRAAVAAHSTFSSAPLDDLPPPIVGSGVTQQRPSVDNDNWVMPPDSSWSHWQQPLQPFATAPQSFTARTGGVDPPTVSLQPPRALTATTGVIRSVPAAARQMFKDSVDNSYMKGVMRFCGDFPNDCDVLLDDEGCSGLQLAIRKAINIAAHDDTPLRDQRFTKCQDIAEFLLMLDCDPTRSNYAGQSVIDDLLQCVTAQGCPSSSRLALFKLLFPASTLGVDAILEGGYGEEPPPVSYVPERWHRSDGETLLHLAARHRAWDCLTFMLSISEIKQTLVDMVTNDSRSTAYHYVIRNCPQVSPMNADQEELLNYRLCLGESVRCAGGDKLDAGGLAPVHLAVLNGQAWLVQELIEADEMALYYRTDGGNGCAHTILSLAAAYPYPHVDVLAVILDRMQRLDALKMQVNAVCSGCGTPLLHSMASAHNCASPFIVSAITPPQGYRASDERILFEKLIVLVDRCNTQLDLNCKDIRGNTVLHLIAKSIVRHIPVDHLEYSTDAEYLLNECVGRQSLDSAAADDGVMLACCLYLIALGADPTIRNDAGVTAAFAGLHKEAALLMNRFHDIRRYGKRIVQDSTSALFRVVDAPPFVPRAAAAAAAASQYRFTIADDYYSEQSTCELPGTSGASSHADGYCIICQENQAVVRYRPCAHRHLCTECARRTAVASLRCITCKHPVKQLVDSAGDLIETNDFEKVKELEDQIKNLTSHLNEVKSIMECPICFEPMGGDREHYSIHCGHEMCGACLQRINQECPICRQPMLYPRRLYRK